MQHKLNTPSQEAFRSKFFRRFSFRAAYHKIVPLRRVSATLQSPRRISATKERLSLFQSALVYHNLSIHWTQDKLLLIQFIIWIDTILWKSSVIRLKRVVSLIGVHHRIPIFKSLFVAVIRLHLIYSHFSNNESPNFSTFHDMLCSSSTAIWEKYFTAPFYWIFPISLPYWALFNPIKCCLHRYWSKPWHLK